MKKEEKNRLEKARQLAQIMFLHGNVEQKQIAADLEVSEQAVCDWKKKDKWEELKTNLQTTDDAVLGELRYHLQIILKENRKALEDNDPNTKPDAQAVIMYTKAIHYLEVKTGPGAMYQTGIAFIGFMNRENVDLAKQIAPYFKAFISDSLNTL